MPEVRSDSDQLYGEQEAFDVVPPFGNQQRLEKQSIGWDTVDCIKVGQTNAYARLLAPGYGPIVLSTYVRVCVTETNTEGLCLCRPD